MGSQPSSPLSLLLFLLLALAVVTFASSPKATGAEVVADGSSCLTSFHLYFHELLPVAIDFPRQTLHFACPANCPSLAAASLRLRTKKLGNTSRPSQSVPSWPVYGSFPYHPLSSICLAAVHSGVLNASLGGSVWVERFFSVEWDERNVTLYPFDSARGTLSQGVQSQAVSALGETNLTLSSYSCTLHSRGAVFSQRRTAPWSPSRRSPARQPGRAARVQPARPTALPTSTCWPTPSGRSISSSAARTRRTTTTTCTRGCTLSRPSIRNRRRESGSACRTLPSVLASSHGPRYEDCKQKVSPITNSHDFARCMFNPFNDEPWQLLTPCFLNLTIIGGETGTACGLQQLGQCSNEVWTLSISRNVDDTAEGPLRGLRFEWSCCACVFALPCTAVSQHGGGCRDACRKKRRGPC